MKNIGAVVLLVLSAQVGAATIFECEALSSGRFYSSGDCAGHRAVIVSRHQVPDGLPFDQQVDLINKKQSAKKSSQVAADQVFDRNQKCAGIDADLKRLQEKYTNWQYVPVDQVNADQQIERDLKNKRSQLGCATR